MAVESGENFIGGSATGHTLVTMTTPEARETGRGQPAGSAGTSTSPGAYRVRTFKPRRRALSPRRQERFDSLIPEWVVETDDVAAGWGEVFGRTSPVMLDIGIGDGRSCVDLARDHTDLNVVGVDVHTPGIAHAVFCADEAGLVNLRLHHGDVFELLDHVAPSSLVGIRVLFPDPWPKVRHHNRRLVTSDRVAVLVSKLTPGGFLHVATDIADYAAQTAAVCSAHPQLSGGAVERSDRSVTRFEQRGLDAGRSISELVYERDVAEGSGTSPRPSMWASRFSRSTASMNSDTIS